MGFPVGPKEQNKWDQFLSHDKFINNVKAIIIPVLSQKKGTEKVISFDPERENLTMLGCPSVSAFSINEAYLLFVKMINNNNVIYFRKEDTSSLHQC